MIAFLFKSTVYDNKKIINTVDAAYKTCIGTSTLGGCDI